MRAWPAAVAARARAGAPAVAQRGPRAVGASGARAVAVVTFGRAVAGAAGQPAARPLARTAAAAARGREGVAPEGVVPAVAVQPAVLRSGQRRSGCCSSVCGCVGGMGSALGRVRGVAWLTEALRTGRMGRPALSRSGEKPRPRPPSWSGEYGCRSGEKPRPRSGRSPGPVKLPARVAQSIAGELDRPVRRCRGPVTAPRARCGL